MLRRIFILFLFVTMLGGAWLKWGNVPSGIRALELLLSPVFHKDIIIRHARAYKEDPLLVTAIIKVESKFFRKAKSSRGAIGLMQIMPNTAKEIAKELQIKNFRESDLEDPEANIRFGFHYLSKLRKEFGNDDITVLAAYNAGRKNVKKWLKENKKKYLEIKEIEFPETQNFVREVLSTYDWLKKFQRWRKQVLKLYERNIQKAE